MKAPYLSPKPICLVFVLCLCASACMMAQVSMPTFLFPDAGTSGRQFPRITKAPDATLVLSFAVRTGAVASFRVATSSDHGATWSADHFFMESPASAITLQRQTYVIMDNKRVLHGLGANYGAMNMLNLYYTRSEDLGVTWTPKVALKKTADMRHMDFGSIAVDSMGTIYVSYITDSKDESDEYTHDVLVRSTDKGVTWSEEIRVDNFPVGGSCECCNQNIEVGPDGEIAVAFRSNVNNRRDVHVARSNDGGTTFTTPVDIQSSMWMIGGCPATGPSLKYDSRGTLHIAWRDARSATEPGTCFYAALPQGSTTTPTNVNLTQNFSEDADYPYVATSPDGETVGVVWQNPEGVFQGYTVDKGATFHKDTLSTGVNGYPNASLVITPSGPYAIWQMRRGTVTDVAMHTSAPTSVALEDSFSEVTDRRVFDLMGRIVNESDKPGIYVVVDHTPSGYRRHVLMRTACP